MKSTIYKLPHNRFVVSKKIVWKPE
jgi:hypothetical protein